MQKINAFYYSAVFLQTGCNCRGRLHFLKSNCPMSADSSHLEGGGSDHLVEDKCTIWPDKSTLHSS